MSLSIIWAPGTRAQSAELLKFVEAEYGLDSALKFLDKAERTFETIGLFPSSFPKSGYFPNFRKAVISKQTSVYYELT